jgi:hypothetical protein
MAGKVKIGYEGDGAGAGGGLPRTLYDKVFASHAVHTQDDGQLATAHAAATVRFCRVVAQGFYTCDAPSFPRLPKACGDSVVGAFDVRAQEQHGHHRFLQVQCQRTCMWCAAHVLLPLTFFVLSPSSAHLVAVVATHSARIFAPSSLLPPPQPSSNISCPYRSYPLFLLAIHHNLFCVLAARDACVGQTTTACNSCLVQCTK